MRISELRSSESDLFFSYLRYFSVKGCPAGFFDLGTMGPSKHDSIDNSDSFHLQPIKNCSDHFWCVFGPPQNPRNSDPDMGNLTWTLDLLDSPNPRSSVCLPHGYGSSGIVSGSVSYLIKWYWSFLNSLWAPRYLTLPLVESPHTAADFPNQGGNPTNLMWISEIHVRFPKSGFRFRGFWGGWKTQQKWSERIFTGCWWKLSLLSIESCLLGPIAPRSPKPAGHPIFSVQCFFW